MSESLTPQPAGALKSLTGVEKGPPTIEWAGPLRGKVEEEAASSNRLRRKNRLFKFQKFGEPAVKHGHYEK